MPICTVENKPKLDSLFPRSGKRLPARLTAKEVFRVHTHGCQMFWTSLDLHQYLDAAADLCTLPKAVLDPVSCHSLYLVLFLEAWDANLSSDIKPSRTVLGLALSQVLASSKLIMNSPLQICVFHQADSTQAREAGTPSVCESSGETSLVSQDVP